MSLSNIKLYQITNEYLSAIDHCLTGETHVSEALDEIKDTLESKFLNVAAYVKNLEAEGKAQEDAAKEMLERSKTTLRHAESLKEYLRYNLEKSGLSEPIKGLQFDIKLQQNPPSLIIDNPELVPDVYKVKKEIIEIDKTQLKQDIKDGFEVEGCRLESKKRIVIK